VSLLALINNRPVHFVGVRSADDLQTLQQAKNSGINVTVSVPFQALAPTSANAGELFHLIDAIDSFDFTGADSNEAIALALPTLFTAVKNDKLTIEQVQQRVSAAPARIFGLTAHSETSVQLDVNWSGRTGSNSHVCYLRL
jgi:dihydroorotase-like cyclic amidohydrolase